MNGYLVCAAALTVLLGVAHSVLGEVLIFSRLRANEAVRNEATRPFSRRQLAVIWSTWHLLSVLALGIAALLLRLSLNGAAAGGAPTMTGILSLTFLASALLWLIGVKGRHPAWVVFLAIAALIWLAPEV